MPSASQPLEIAIIGAGIGGLALAIALKDSPHNITLYEAAPEFKEIGAGVAFSANALQALKLIQPSLLDAYMAKADVDKGDHEGRDHVMDYRLGQSVGGRKEGDWIGTVKGLQKGIHRATFLDILVERVPEGVAKFGKRVKTIQEGDRVKINFEDGESVEVDALIGCDGIKSVVRGAVLGEKGLIGHELGAQFSGKYCYRGLVPMEKAVAALGEETAKNRGMLIGHQGHLVIFPIADATLLNIVAFRTKKDGKWDHNNMIETVDKQAMLDDFSGWSETITNLLSNIDKPQRWAIFNHPPPPTYTKGYICLLGDSAHASSPHHGAGAGMAIEDALILSRLLRQCYTRESIQHGFKAYDANRRPRDVKLVSSSREAGLVRGLEVPEFWEGESLNLNKVFQTMDTEARWIWDADLEKELEAAFEIYNKSASQA